MDISVFHKLLISAIQKNASDIHLQAGYPPLMRVNGELLEVKYHPLEPDETMLIAKEILRNTYWGDRINELSEQDVSYGIEGHGRFRVNIFRQRGSLSIVLRVIPVAIRSIRELNLPSVLEQIANLSRGLVIVSGATGNGKSTTLSSMIEHINQSRRAHVVTVEDPIEYLFKHKLSVISQRELGSDTPSFSAALQAVLRQDPDVIMIGEMRDAETTDTALRAAETGHLVLASLHTTDAEKTINRIVGFYPQDEEMAVRKRIADSLMAIISLRLLPLKSEIGRIPAVEVLRVTRTIQGCIRDPEKTEELPGHMAKGRDMYGMQTFDMDLARLVKTGKLELEVAKAAASNPDEFERTIMLDE